MSEIKDPESLDSIASIKITDDIRDFTNQVYKKSVEEKQNRSDWETRMDSYTRKRYGIRSKKTFPWPGSANFILPQIDSDINRLKPAYINLAMGVSPIVTFEPFGAEDVEPARKREVLFDWRMRTQVKFFKDYCLSVDYMLHNGFSLFKTGWRFETRTYTKVIDLKEIPQQILEALYMPEVTDEFLMAIFEEEFKPDMSLEENVEALKKAVEQFRKGKSRFEVEFTEKSINRAECKALNPREDVVFPVGTCDIQEAQFIDHKFSVTKDYIKKGIKSGKYNSYSDDDIDGWTTKTTGDTFDEQVKYVRDGIRTETSSDDCVVLHEISTWYDTNGDGVDERVIITFPESDPESILRFIENPYDHGQFPYVVIRREYNDAEIMSSRGIPALDDDFQTGISTLFNQDIDAGTITTTPTVVARKNSVKNLRNLRYVPGQVVETENGTQDYTVVQNTNLGQANRFNNMQYLKAWANDRIGNLQAAISQINNTPGSGPQGTKTAKEVGAIEGAASQQNSMDLLVFQNQMVELYYQLDSLYYQFGDDEESIAITGQPAMRISRKEQQGKFNIVPNGRLDNSNPQLRAAKAQARLQMFANDPYIRQDQLRKQYLDDDDLRLSQVLLKTPQEMLADQRAAEAQQVKQLQTALLMQKGKDNLEVIKEAQLAPIQGRKYGPDPEPKKETSASKK